MDGRVGRGLVTPEFVSGAEAFPKDSELACGVAGRVASCVAGVLGHRPYGGSDTGRMKRTLRVIAVQGGAKERDFGSLQQTLGDCCNLTTVTIFRRHVSSDNVHIGCIRKDLIAWRSPTAVRSLRI